MERMSRLSKGGIWRLYKVATNKLHELPMLFSMRMIETPLDGSDKPDGKLLRKICIRLIISGYHRHCCRWRQRLRLSLWHRSPGGNRTTMQADEIASVNCCCCHLLTSKANDRASGRESLQADKAAGER